MDLICAFRGISDETLVNEPKAPASVLDSDHSPCKFCLLFHISLQSAHTQGPASTYTVVGNPSKSAIRPLPSTRVNPPMAAIHLDPMRVFGIDCGTEVTGFGIVESDDTQREPRLVCKAMGAIRLKKTKTT